MELLTAVAKSESALGIFVELLPAASKSESGHVVSPATPACAMLPASLMPSAVMVK